MESGIVCYFDGACEPKNPGGNMGLGAVIFIDGKEFAAHSKFIRAHETNTSNVAEYGALSWILSTLLHHGLNEKVIYIYGDSMLVVKQMTGKWKIKFGHYVQYALGCKELLKHFKNTLIQWIPREQNTYADELSKIEMGFDCFSPKDAEHPKKRFLGHSGQVY